MARRSLTSSLESGSSERVGEDDPLAGADDLWADEDHAWQSAAPVFVPHPESLDFLRGFLLAAAISIVLWLLLAAAGFAVYGLFA